MMQIQSHVTQNAPRLAVAGFMIPTAAGLIAGASIGYAGDDRMGWIVFFVGLFIGLAWAFVILWKSINHQVELENKAAEIAVTRANAELAKIAAPAQPSQPVAQLPSPIPNYMAPRSEMQFAQVGKDRFVRREPEPVEGEDSSWPTDKHALKVALELMRVQRLPTKNNFALMGMNSGSRYEKIRSWLVGAGLAINAGDGNPTIWTRKAIDQSTQEEIQRYLLAPSLSE